MANTFLTPSIIANEALMVLQANMVMADLVHRDYSSEFVNVGDTITVSVIRGSRSGDLSLTLQQLQPVGDFSTSTM